MPHLILSRSLTVQSPGGLRCLDAVAWPSRQGLVLRAFFATGTLPAAFRNPPAAGCAIITEAREVSGGTLLAAFLPGSATVNPDLPGTRRISLDLAETGPVLLTVMPAETGLFAGLNTALLIRTDEPAETLRDWLLHHRDHHGLQAALIVNRLPDAALAGRLRHLLDSAPDDAAPDDTAPGDAAPGLPAPSPDTARENRARVRRSAAGTAPATRATPRLPAALTIVLLDCPTPLGLPGTGAQSHPFLAPDAPGKDRMDQPAPDQWRAPLGEMLLLEAAKWRFLSRARAVLCLDVSDMLPPRPPSTVSGQPTIFDRATTARQGIVPLTGRNIYPWRIRPGARPTFGDHICRPFDSATGIARWCVAPQVAGLQATWRPNRIAFAKPETETATGFYRCMAIRHPGHATAELVPKTSLIEDPALVALALDTFRHNPVRAPKSVPHAAPDTGTLQQTVPAGTRTAIITTMKNEGPFILEWLAYHRAIGVTDFLIYTNDCTDGTDTLLDLLQSKGLVQHRDNPFRATTLKPQHAALQAAEAEPLIRDAAWAICMDVDEFIHIKTGDGTLPALYAAMGDANMISLTWRLFGNADIHTHADDFILNQFTRCAPALTRKPHQAWGFKTLFRNIGIYKKLGVHRPKGLKPDLWDQIRWRNGSGKPMPIEMLRNGWRSTTTTYGYDLVSLNHYAVRSAESFLVKRDRGRVNHVDRDQGLNYWFRMNFNAETDTGIQRMIPALTAEYRRLLADPEIRAAHLATVLAHRAKIAELRAQPEPAAFYAELTSPHMEKLCRLQAHFGSAVFAAGPGVIPPGLTSGPLAPDFFFTVPQPATGNHTADDPANGLADRKTPDPA